MAAMRTPVPVLVLVPVRVRPRGCWRPGMRRPARGTGSASPSRSARRCCTRPRPRWPAVNATALAARLGAQSLGDQIAILARRARIRLDGGDGSGAAGAGDGGAGGGLGPGLGLTERELEVL